MNELDRPDVVLRPETDLDNDFLLALYISTRDVELLSIGWSAGDIEPFLTQQFIAQTLAYRQSYPDADYRLVELDGTPVGRFYSNQADNEYRLIDISLLPAFRNQALGSFLIQTLQATATKAGLPISLHVEHNNLAQRLYRRLGFTESKDDGIYTMMTWAPK